MIAPIKPLETRAYGRRFRSRTEARWAVAFTKARISWQYEPEGFDLPSGPYLPDFWLPQVSMWAEVKGSGFTLPELRKAHDLANASGGPVLLLIGQPADLAYYAIEPDTDEWNPPFSLADGTRVFVMDYAPFELSHYHLYENRMFGGCGMNSEFPAPWEYTDSPHAHPAVVAALAARFEHGETPT